jgi:hypothetical protein
MLQIDVNFIDRLAKTCKKFPDRSVDIMQSVKKNQINSKLEIFKHIPNNSRVCIMGGWYGAPYLLANPTCDYTFVDLDQQCAVIGKYLWQGRPATFIEGDALLFDTSPFDVIINSSTEHMDKNGLADSLQRIQPGKKCILQNSNQRAVLDHINCFKSADEFSDWTSNYMLISSTATTLMDNGSSRFTLICQST